MLFPFLPYIIAISGAGIVLGMGAEDALPPWPAWATPLVYLLLIALGGTVTRLPRLPNRRFSPLSLSPARWAYLALWLSLLSLSALPQRLIPSVGEEMTLVLLVLNFWWGDTLAALPPQHLSPGETRLAHRLLNQARLPLPVLVLMLGGLLITALVDALGLEVLAAGPLEMVARTALSLVIMVLGSMILVPLAMRHGWGLQPLEGPTAQLLAAELAANGVRVSHILNWPDHLTGQATAGVIGLIPGFRYLLFSPTLAERLAPEELCSVTAHEAAHIRHRHLWFFLAALLGAILWMEGLSLLAFWGGLLLGFPLPIYVFPIFQVAGLLLFLRFGLGFISRNFERQADGNAVERHGWGPFSSALTKVAALNQIPVQQDNWHHYGIMQRLAFADAVTSQPATVTRQHQRVRRIKLGLAALMVSGALLMVTTSGEGFTNWVGERYLASALDGLTEFGEEHLPALQYQAMQALKREDFPTAERYFRIVLDLRPADTQSRNNLAWVLVTTPGAPEPRLREGLALARQAAQENPQAYILDTLAEAHYQLGEQGEAKRAASEALRLAEAGQGVGDATLRFYRERLASINQGALTRP